MNAFIDNDSDQTLGLTNQRSYSIVDIRQAEEISAIIIRDPWATDFAHKYSATLFQNATEKTIEIPIASFINNIKTVNVAMIYPHWHVTQKVVKGEINHQFRTAF